MLLGPSAHRVWNSGSGSSLCIQTSFDSDTSDDVGMPPMGGVVVWWPLEKDCTFIMMRLAAGIFRAVVLRACTKTRFLCVRRRSAFQSFLLAVEAKSPFCVTIDSAWCRHLWLEFSPRLQSHAPEHGSDSSGDASGSCMCLGLPRGACPHAFCAWF